MMMMMTEVVVMLAAIINGALSYDWYCVHGRPVFRAWSLRVHTPRIRRPGHSVVRPNLIPITGHCVQNTELFSEVSCSLFAVLRSR